MHQWFAENCCSGYTRAVLQWQSPGTRHVACNVPDVTAAHGCMLPACSHRLSLVLCLVRLRRQLMMNATTTTVLGSQHTSIAMVPPETRHLVLFDLNGKKPTGGCPKVSGCTHPVIIWSAFAAGTICTFKSKVEVVEVVESSLHVMPFSDHINSTSGCLSYP